MSEFAAAKELIDQKLSEIDDLDTKEKYLRQVIRSGALNTEQLTEIKKLPHVSRYLALVYIIDKYIETEGFSKSNEKAKNESPLKVLAGISLIGLF